MNEKSVYEILQDQIDRQDRVINKLIKTNVIISLLLVIVMIVFTMCYFLSDYDYMSNSNNTTVTGDSNSVTNDNELKESSIETYTDGK